jgi:hypothetical protein
LPALSCLTGSARSSSSAAERTSRATSDGRLLTSSADTALELDPVLSKAQLEKGTLRALVPRSVPRPQDENVELTALRPFEQLEENRMPCAGRFTVRVSSIGRFVNDLEEFEPVGARDLPAPSS